MPVGGGDWKQHFCGSGWTYATQPEGFLPATVESNHGGEDVSTKLLALLPPSMQKD